MGLRTLRTLRILRARTLRALGLWGFVDADADAGTVTG